MQFSTSLSIIVYTRPSNLVSDEWVELDRGPGFFNLPPDHVAMIRIKKIDDTDLRLLVKDLAGISAIISLDLSENRKITDDGLEFLKGMPQLTSLNLSSCDITNKGLVHLLALNRLTRLNLSYCNRLTDSGLITLQKLTHLTDLDLLGVLKVTRGGLVRITRPGLNVRW
jgi:F-box and leucine-rich repeat protein 14